MILKKKVIKNNNRFTRVPYYKETLNSSICDQCIYNDDDIYYSICLCECEYIDDIISTDNFGYIIKEKID